VAMPRNSFVRAALVGCKSVATILRVTMAGWWHRETPIGRRLRERAGPRRVQTVNASHRPQPLSAFPELECLIVHEPWLADPAARARRIWADVGWGGDHYAFFIISNGRRRTLGMLMRERHLAYTRLYSNLAFAAVDSTLWAREIHHDPAGHSLVWGGVDDTRRKTWSVRVVQRERRCELQITNGGLIPWTRDYRSLEEATISAEAWLTDLQHKEQAPIDHEWLM
jgi:hypothetical protein